MPESARIEVDLATQVEQLLREAKINYEREKIVGDTRPDFLVLTESGDHIVVEVKNWEPSPEATARAFNHAQRYKELSKAGASVVVMPAVVTALASSPMFAITPLAQLVGTILTLSNKLAQRKKPSKAAVVWPAPKKRVFASMPFAPQYDDTFLVAIEPASLANGAAAERVDHSGSAGPVIPQIKAMIEVAKVIVADLSESRPNVLHEIGFAEGLKKPVIQICSTAKENLPFNVRNNQTIQYSIGQVSKLRRYLEAKIKKYV